MRLRLIICLPVLCSATVLMATSHAFGQQETNSQRLLPLPQGSNNDLRRQMELLRQFQELMSRGQPNQPGQQNQPGQTELKDSTSSGNQEPTLPLNQLNQLREAFEKLGGRLPSGLDPSALKDIPQDKLQKAMQNPEIQQQVRSLLEQFSRDGVLPQNSQQDSAPLPLPFPNQKSEQSGGGNRRIPQRRPDAPSRTTKEPSEETPDNKTPPNNKTPLAEDNAEMEQPAAAERAQQESNQTPEPSSDPSRPSANQLPDLSKLRPEMVQELNQLMQNLKQETDEPSFQSRGNNSASRDNTSRSNSPMRSSGMTPGNSNSLPKNSRADNSSGGSSQSAADLLKELQDNLPRNWTPPRVQPGSTPGMNSGAQSRSDTGQGAGTEKPLDIKRELERGDLGSAFRRIVEQARQEDRQEQQRLQSLQEPAVDPSISSQPADLETLASPETPGSSRLPKTNGPATNSSERQDSTSSRLSDSAKGMADRVKDLATDPDSQERLNKAISGIGAELKEMAEEGRFNRTDGGGSDRSSGSSGNLSSGRSSGNSLNGAGNAASGLLDRITSAPRSPTSTGSQSGGGMSMPSLPSAESASAMVWFLAVVFGLIAVAGIAVLMMRLGAPKLFDRLTMKPPTGEPLPSSIRSRQDIIKFFHAYALRPETSAESWWTHRRVEEEFKQQIPHQSRAVETLTNVYEQARYLPQEQPLPDEQLAAADRAMHEIGVMPK